MHGRRSGIRGSPYLSPGIGNPECERQESNPYLTVLRAFYVLNSAPSVFPFHYSRPNFLKKLVSKPARRGILITFPKSYGPPQNRTGSLFLAKEAICRIDIAARVSQQGTSPVGFDNKFPKVAVSVVTSVLRRFRVPPKAPGRRSLAVESESPMLSVGFEPTFRDRKSRGIAKKRASTTLREHISVPVNILCLELVSRRFWGQMSIAAPILLEGVEPTFSRFKAERPRPLDRRS